MSPHLERETSDGSLLKIEGTGHKQCSHKKKLPLNVVIIHGLLEDTPGVVEVADELGDVCFRPAKKKRVWRNNWDNDGHNRGGISLEYI